MARLSIALFALLAVVAAVSAEGPAPGPPPPPAPHGIKAWIAQKEGQLKAWGHAEKAKLQNTWQHTLVPQIQQLRQKLGAEWQQKAPQVAALLKEKAGHLFDKALQAAGNIIG